MLNRSYRLFNPHPQTQTKVVKALESARDRWPLIELSKTFKESTHLLVYFNLLVLYSKPFTVYISSEDDNLKEKATKAKPTASTTEKQNELRRQKGNEMCQAKGGGRIKNQKNHEKRECDTT